MPKFDASQFSDVEYDLTGFRSTKTGDYTIQDKGVIPEPDRHTVADTMKRISAAFKKLDLKGTQDLGDNPTPDQVASAMNALDAEEMDKFAEMSDELLEILADLCDGHPSRESLDQLSWPKFMAFFGYIMENLLSPEASTPGTNDTQRRLRSA